MFKYAKFTLPTLAAFLFMGISVTVNAGAVKCSEFGGFIPAGTHDYNIIVDVTCHVSGGAIVNGNISEPRNTDYSIYVFSTGIVNGNIEEKGPGLVFVVVGGDQLYVGDISEKGDGMVKVWVDGVFHGNVVEQNNGDVDIQVFGGFPSGGPGFFIGSTLEKGAGDAFLGVSEEEGTDPRRGDGHYDGSFTEKGPGICYIKEHTVNELPTVDFHCATLEWPD